MIVRTGAVFFCVALCLAALGATTAPAAESSQRTVVIERNSDERGWLGVSITDVTDEVRKKESLPDGVSGVLVLEVYDDSPAEKAAMKEGDVITMAAGAKVEGVAKLVDLIRSSAPGKEITINVLRDGKPLSVTATLTDRSAAKAVWVGELEGLEDLEGLEALQALKTLSIDIPRLELGLAGTSGRGRLGVYIDDLSEGLGEYFGVPEGEGVLVEDIVEGSPAEKAGIRAGDVITKIGGESVGDTEELREAIGDMDAGKETPLVVWRDGKQQTLTVTVEETESAKALKAYFDAQEDGDEIRVIRIGAAEEAADLKEAVEELKAEIEELKEEIRELEEQADTD